MAELPRLNGIIKALEESSVAFVGSAPADGATGTSAPYDGALFEMEHGPYDIRALQEGLHGPVLAQLRRSEQGAHRRRQKLR
jgi:4-hydroxy-2-oxoheptanedioate aldolase